ncbi:deoxycytidylate deaminase [Rhizobium leguminosarum]|uniref:deoxycytidylate deaminase n=1 Tax=Rhizobium leguminosarum TaxID=384 RepID=UPI001C98ABEB|nr:deaminase [Rhizobium leguminosarum]MBY5348496.1 CMP deaminase [Rhizobium leguminosarum]
MAISNNDRQFLLLCEEVKAMSYDPHRKVGAVVVDANGNVIAGGANAPPPVFGLSRQETEAAISQDPSWKYFMLEHAERNAIYAARDKGVSLVGATMYGTLFPCADCARAIVAAGIVKLVVSTADSDPRRDEKWRDHYNYARQIFSMSDVVVDLAEPTDVLRSKVG